MNSCVQRVDDNRPRTILPLTVFKKKISFPIKYGKSLPYSIQCPTKTKAMTKILKKKDT